MHAIAAISVTALLRTPARRPIACRIVAGARYPIPRTKLRNFHSSPVRRSSLPVPEENGSGNENNSVIEGEARTAEVVKDGEKKVARNGRINSARARANRGKQQQQNGLPPVELPKGYWERCVLCAGDARRFGNLAEVRMTASGKEIRLIRTPRRPLLDFEARNKSPSKEPSLVSEETIEDTTNSRANLPEKGIGGGPDSMGTPGLPNLAAGDFTINHGVYNEIKCTIRADLALRPPQRPNGQRLSRSITVLQCPQDGAMNFLDSVVETVAEDLNADLIRLDAQDFAETLGPYVGENVAWQSPQISALGYETARVAGKLEDFSNARDSPPVQEDLETAEDEDEAPTANPGRIIPSFPSTALKKMLKSITLGLPSNKSSPDLADGGSPWMQVLDLRRPDAMSKLDSNSHEPDSWTNLKMTTALERLIKGADDRRASRARTGEAGDGKLRSLIVQIHDYKEISGTRVGSDMLSKLRSAIDKKWHEGRDIICVGATANAQTVLALSKSEIHELQSDAEGETRTIYVPTERDIVTTQQFNLSERNRLRTINVRQIEDMITRMSEGTKLDGLELRIAEDIRAQDLGPSEKLYESEDASTSEPRVELNDVDSGGPHDTHELKETPPLEYVANLEDAVWTYARVRRLVTTILGDNDPLRRIGMREFCKAMNTLSSSDEAKVAYGKAVIKVDEEESNREKELDFSKSKLKGQMDKIKDLEKSCNSHEKKLLKGIVLSRDIKTTFEDIRAPPDTIEALKTLTGLSLLRPEAFIYGVLATDKIPGLLLYGPPGTGKTLLAKAVAKESGATVLEISGADVNDMYVGEGEKNVKAVFSLAKKLSPCIVFIDEADAIFAARGAAGKQRSHRELINQFLREWDGMKDMSTFIMIATNRPFDLDDAVLRRLPRKLLVDLPLEKDREAILSIHLKDEILDSSVSMLQLAKDTPFYSGSDLKNVAVAAALACIREENTIAANYAGETPHVYPEKRILRKEHFVKALEEISASVSEDMGTLAQIRKFDERYGDRKGRRKKSAGLGFGGTRVVEKDSEAARVRKLEA